MRRTPRRTLSQLLSFLGPNNMAQSAFDRRRINGPEESFPPVFADEEQAFVKSGAPRNGRAAKDIRPICTSIFTEAERC